MPVVYRTRLTPRNGVKGVMPYVCFFLSTRPKVCAETHPAKTKSQDGPGASNGTTLTQPFNVSSSSSVTSQNNVTYCTCTNTSNVKVTLGGVATNDFA